MISFVANTDVAGSTPSRRLELDFLRGIAILLVTLGHHAIPLGAGWLSPLAWAWSRFGWTGVDLFFVLSGFLVGGLLFQEQKKHGRINLGRFLVRRGFKIWPLYFLYLAMATIAQWLSHGRDWVATWSVLWPNYFHVQNYFPTPLEHTWSLAVEEHFYLALPLVLVLVGHLACRPLSLGRVLPGILVGVMLVCPALRCLNILRAYSFSSHHWQTHIRIDSLSYGVMLAFLFHFCPARLQTFALHPLRWLGLSGLLLTPLLFWNHHDEIIFTVGFSIIALGYALLLAVIVAGTPQSQPLQSFFGGRLARGVAFIGLYSYPIYLFHYRLGQFPARWLLGHVDFAAYPTLGWLVVTLTNLITIVFVGVLFGRLAERPMLRLRDALFPSRSAA